MKYEALGLATLVLVMAIVISVVLLFVGMGVLVLIHVCVVGRAMSRGFGNNNNNNNNSLAVERGSLGSRSMSRDDLEKLPCFEFNAKEMKGSTTNTTRNSSPVDCAVCLEKFKAGEKCRLLPLCRHSFHAECVDMWLLRTPICPICRATADLQMTTVQSGHLSMMASIGSLVSQAAASGSLTEAVNEPGNGQALGESTLSMEPATASTTSESQTPPASGGN